MNMLTISSPMASLLIAISLMIFVSLPLLSFAQIEDTVIISAGMLGTGSSSLKSAVGIVSVNTVKCYDIHNVAKDADKWRKVITSSADESSNVIKSIVNDAFPASQQKQPICLIDVGFALPQLLKTYPKAKVVLTTRDFESWFYNYVRSFLAVDDAANKGVGNMIYNIVFGAGSDGESDVANVKSSFTDLWNKANVISSKNMLDKQTLMDDFNKWSESVRKTVPSNQLLEIPFGDGDLNALCTYLKCDSRAASLTWKYYPHAAESEEQEKFMKINEARNLIGILIGFIGLLISLYLMCFISTGPARQLPRSSSSATAATASTATNKSTQPPKNSKASKAKEN